MDSQSLKWLSNVAKLSPFPVHPGGLGQASSVWYGLLLLSFGNEMYCLPVEGFG